METVDIPCSPVEQNPTKMETNQKETVEDVDREAIMGYAQPIDDVLGGVVISGPGVGPSGMQPRPLELRRIMAKISRHTEDSLLKARRFSMEQSASYVLYRQVEKQSDFCPFTPLPFNQRQRVVTLMSRVYVSGINPDIREETVELAFSPFGPIRRVDMSWDSSTRNKGFAFVEFEVLDSAELALDQMNNKTIANQAIKVTRPVNAPSTTPMIESILEEAKPYPRVFISNIHPQVHSRDLRSLFEAFGKIRSCVIVGERNPKHKGIAYIEFEEHQCANEAIASMNLFDLGGQQLRVGKAITLACHLPEDKGLPPAAALAMAAVSAKLQGKNKVVSNTSNMLVPAEKKSKESLLDKPPIENLMSVIVSPAMVQAGLSDVAADLVNSADINALIAPDFYRYKQELIKMKQKRKDDKNGRLAKNQQKLEDEKVRELEKEAVVDVKEEEKNEGSPKRSRKRSSRSRSPSRRRRSKDRQSPLRRRHRSRSRRRSPSRGRYRRHSPPREKSRYRSSPTDKPKHRSPPRNKQRGKREKSDNPNGDSNMLEDASIKGTNARLLVMQKLARNLDSDVLLLRNLVPPEEVDDDLRTELHEEFSKYGKIKQLIVNKEQQKSEDKSNIEVKIFVQYDSVENAEKAHASLNSRYFSGKPIKAEFYEREKFENKDYTA